MTSIDLLGRVWKGELVQLVESVQSELLVASPYITHDGTSLITQSLSQSARRHVHLLVLTDLSPLHICQKATDPRALRDLMADVDHVRITHVRRLHAKVYVADADRAIVTSANLTRGGLEDNCEYGVRISDSETAKVVHQDILDYSGLGADVSAEQLAVFCRYAVAACAAYRRQQASARRSAREAFVRAVRAADDELIRLQLAGGAVHTVFARTIVYLLKMHGPLSTERLHPLIQAIHPDLCDDHVDRVIDGQRFGKKWKHAVRTAQQQLKKRGLIRLSGGCWAVTPAGLSVGAV